MLMTFSEYEWLKKYFLNMGKDIKSKHKTIRLKSSGFLNNLL